MRRLSEKPLFGWDVALAPDADGQVVVHLADCPLVRDLVDAGAQVMTLHGLTLLPQAPFAPCLQEALDQ